MCLVLLNSNFGSHPGSGSGSYGGLIEFLPETWSIARRGWLVSVRKKAANHVLWPKPKLPLQEFGSSVSFSSHVQFNITSSAVSLSSANLSLLHLFLKKSENAYLFLPRAICSHFSTKSPFLEVPRDIRRQVLLFSVSSNEIACEFFDTICWIIVVLKRIRVWWIDLSSNEQGPFVCVELKSYEFEDVDVDVDGTLALLGFDLLG